ncbi:MAG TPA: hypothetical protein VGD37_31770 [Kofleriaceae bacterium]|jgi:hypothetical protein
MSGRPARSSEASPPRVVVVDGQAEHEVFDVVDFSGQVLRVRSAFLFEVGEELSIRIERGGGTADALARVRAHTGPDDARITELEVSELVAPAAGPAAPTGPGGPGGRDGAR